MSQTPARIAVFISGRGSNLQALIDASKVGTLSGEIVLVVSSSPDAYGLTRAENNNVPTFTFLEKEYDSKETATAALLRELKKSDVDYIALAGYLKLIEPQIIAVYRNRIINIHPALLPKFGGKGMFGLRVHQAVLAAGETESGLTIHLVDEKYDHGRMLKQVKVPVYDDDTPELLQQRIQVEEHRHYPAVLDRFIKGEYEFN
jgi:phosphoribosylglycinamide formyltransferase-1